MGIETQRNISPGARRLIMIFDRVAGFFSAHWLLVASISLFVFIALPALAPVFMYLGLTGPADLIYLGYRLTCHELAFRTYFFFGEQPVYTLSQLSALVGPHTDDPMFWTTFLGNSQLGYKMAWCERNTAIYTSMFVASMVFGLVRARLKPLDWRIYLALITPMAIDGFWQLVTSPVPLVSFLPVHESNWWLRGFTGILFGVGSVWLIYPYLEEAMRDLRAQTQAQLARAKARQAAQEMAHRPTFEP